MKIIDTTLAGKGYQIHVTETVEDLVEFTEWISIITAKGFSILGLDCETTGLDPWDPEWRLTLVQLSDGVTTWVVPLSCPGAGDALLVLDRPNLKFVTHTQIDAIFLAAGTGVVLGQRVIDTMILSRLLSPGNRENHGLKPLVTKWLSAPELEEADAERKARFKELAKEHGEKGLTRSPTKVESWGWQNVDPMDETLLRYAGLDALAVRQLAPVMIRLLKGQSSVVKMEMWLAALATSMRVRGIQLDTQRVELLLEGHKNAIAEAGETVKFFTGLPSPLSPGRVEWLQGKGVEFDPEKVTESGRPKLDKETLPVLVERYPDGEVGEVLRACLTLSTRKNTVGNLENFLKWADPEGRVHPEIKTLRARTARMSITNPALQTMKKDDPELRGCFLADPGKVLISCDFSQIEVRVAAALSGDVALSTPLLSGVDAHSDTAARLFGPDFTDADRQIAKKCNFGSLYGAGAKALSDQAGISVERAREVVNLWRQTYPSVTKMSQALATMPCITNPIGRQIPTDPERRYAALNYMIQSTARDLFVLAVRRIVDEFGSEPLVLFVHDEVVLQVPEEEAEEMAARIGKVMETTFYGIPVLADAKVLGKRWSGE